MARRRTIEVQVVFEPGRGSEQALQLAYQCVSPIIAREVRLPAAKSKATERKLISVSGGAVSKQG